MTQAPATRAARARRRWLLAAALLVALGALLHLAIPLGGPAWYAWFGAPDRLVDAAARGDARPWLTCIAIAAVLAIVAAYGASAAGAIRRLPLLRWMLLVFATGLLVRGLAFVPFALWFPQRLAQVCGRCDGVDGFVLATSAACLFAGVGYALGAFETRRRR